MPVNDELAAREQVHEVWEGVAEAGPLAGEMVHSWGPKGLLVVSESTRQTWVYDYDPQHHRFACRETGSVDDAKLAKAQEDGGRAIRVVD